MNTQLQIYLFGTPQFTYQGKPLTGFVSNKARALLIYLAVTGRAHSREALAELFWADTPLSKRKNLKKVLSNLRNLDGIRLIEESSQRVGLDPDYCWVDLWAFHQVVVQSDATVAIDEYARAVALYQDDFLAGFNLSLSYEFEAWALGKQTELRTQFIDLLNRLAESYVRSGKLPQAIATIRRLLQLEPWREEVHRRLMTLLAQDGQRSAALAHFAVCKRLLQEELAAEPDQATVALYQQLQHQPTAVVTLPPQFKTTVDYSLVGRAEEWAILRKHWQTLTRPHFVCISGEAGIGKTRLAEELLMFVERNGQPTARARYHAIQGHLPYGPVADWLRTASFHPTLAQLDGIWLRELARLLPELLIQHPTLEPPQPLQTGWERKQLYEALTHTFSRGVDPLLLLLDDLHWCDADTLEWLQYLLERSTRPLLLVGTVRSDELESDHPLHRLRRQLYRTEQFTELALQPLTTKATSLLANQVAPRPLPESQATKLHRDMAGNPLFIIESVRTGLAHDGTDTDWQSQVETIPTKVYSVIQMHLNQLSSTTIAIVQVAATIGRAFDIELLRRAANQPEERILQGLDELWQRQIIREFDSTHFDFRHDRIRDVAYMEIGPFRRRLLHRHVAEALEESHGESLDMVAGELGNHYQQAGILDKALICFRQAATAAQRLFAVQEVANYVEKAVAVVQMMPRSTETVSELLELWHDLGWVLIRLYDWGSEPVMDVWNKLYRLAHEEGNALHECRALLNLDVAYRNQGQWQEARKCVESAFAFLSTIHKPYLAMDIYLSYGGILYQMGELQRSLVFLEEALTVSATAEQRPFGWKDSVPLSTVFARSAKAWCIAGYADRARERSEEAQRLTVAHPEQMAYYGVWDFTAMLYSFLRDIERVNRLGYELITASQRYEFPFYERAGMIYLGWVKAHGGEMTEGIQLIRENIATHRANGNRTYEPYWHGLLAETLALADQIVPAMNAVDHALRFAKESGNCYWNAQLLKQKGDYHARLAAPPTIVETFYQQAIDVARQQQAKFLELRATASLCRHLQKERRATEAHRLLAPIYNWFTEGFDTVDLIEAKELLDELTQ